MIHMHANQFIADRFQKQSGYYRAIDTSRQGQQNFLIPYLTLYQFNLVIDKIRHIPVCLSLASIEHERLDSALDRLDIIRKLRQFNLAQRLIVTCGHYRSAHLVNTRIHVDSYTVDNIVWATIDNDTFHVWQGF